MGACRRAILFGVDGGGTFFERANTPNMDRFFVGGAICRRTLMEIPSISAECWGSMLHGVPCEKHGLTNWTATHLSYPSGSPYPSAFKAIREARPAARLAAFCEWPAILRGIIEEDIGVLPITIRARRNLCKIRSVCLFIGGFTRSRNTTSRRLRSWIWRTRNTKRWQIGSQPSGTIPRNG